jgi:hypothetical protein
MHSQTTKLSAFAVVAIFGIAGTQPTRAEISSLSVTSAKDIGPFRDKPYREVEAQLRGTAPGGAYSVPVTIAFPKKASDHNGFTVVDVDNTITVGNKDFPGGGAFPMARASMAEEFLFGRGNAHVGVSAAGAQSRRPGRGRPRRPAARTRVYHQRASSPGTSREGRA